MRCHTLQVKYTCIPRFIEFVNEYRVEAIVLARECDVLEILPAAFYSLSVQRWTHGADGGRSHLTLSPYDLRRLIVGREGLQDFLVTMVAKPLTFQSDEGPRTIHVCPQCHLYLSQYWRERLMSSLAMSCTSWWLIRVLQRMCGTDSDELRLATCAGCAAEHYALAWHRLAALKERIPRFFLLS